MAMLLKLIPYKNQKITPVVKIKYVKTEMSAELFLLIILIICGIYPKAIIVPKIVAKTANMPEKFSNIFTP
jgi:hypothetical protein